MDAIFAGYVINASVFTGCIWKAAFEDKMERTANLSYCKTPMANCPCWLEHEASIQYCYKVTKEEEAILDRLGPKTQRKIGLLL